MEPNPPTARRSGSSLLCKTSQRSACSSTSAAAGQRRMDPFSDGTGMKKGLLHGLMGGEAGCGKGRDQPLEEQRLLARL